MIVHYSFTIKGPSTRLIWGHIFNAAGATGDTSLGASLGHLVCDLGGHLVGHLGGHLGGVQN